MIFPIYREKEDRFVTIVFVLAISRQRKIETLPDQIVFAFKVIVNRHLRNIRFSGDFGNRHFLHAELLEQVQCSL